MEKIFTKNNDENTIVHVVLRTGDGSTYECVGVLTEENEDSIQVAFNTINKKITDDLVFKKSDIVSVTILDRLTIEEFI